jgi:capsular exopolysaccharide synthesis family protein
MSKFFDRAERSYPSSEAQHNSAEIDVAAAVESIRSEAVRRSVDGPIELGPRHEVETAEDPILIGSPKDIVTARLDQAKRIPIPNSPHMIHSADEEETHVAMEAYLSVRTRLMRIAASQGKRTFVITSCMPGEGKTLTSANLSYCCANLKDVSVLVIDADLRTGGLTRRFGHEEAIGLADILENKSDFASAIVGTEQQNLYLLGAGQGAANAAELFSSERWKELVRWVSETFKLVLIDAPPVGPLADFELIAAPCDGVIVVTRALETQREALQKTVSHIEKRKLVGSIYNGAKSAQSRYQYSYYYSHAKKQ